MASVLVVDDEPGIREFLQIMLDREGYDVSCAADGKEAINFFKKKIQNFIEIVLHRGHLLSMSNQSC